MKRDELKQYSGKNGRLAYILWAGKIYDVSASKLWKNGIHMNKHRAGDEEDLAAALKMAPHGPEVLARVALVGSLDETNETSRPSVQTENPLPPARPLTPPGDPIMATPPATLDRAESWRALYRKLHPHPMLIHFPIALFLFAGLMQLLSWVQFSPVNCRFAAYAALCVGTLGAFPATFSGVCSWVINYNRAFTPIFRNKLLFSGLTLILSVAALLMGSRLGQTHAAYQLCLLLNVPVVFFVAYNGGKITWPS